MDAGCRMNSRKEAQKAQKIQSIDANNLSNTSRGLTTC